MGHHRHSSHHGKRSSLSPENKEYTLRELKEKACQAMSSRRHRDYHRDRYDHRRKHSERFERRRRSSSPKRYNHRSKQRRDDDNDDNQFRKHQFKSDQKINNNNQDNKNNRNKNNNDNSNNKEEKLPEIKPNFELTGALARDTNTFNGIVIKYNQPPEAKKPSKHWRLYPFKGSKPMTYISIHNQSAYLLGRERQVADIPIDHPSCSKQHAVIQFRCVPFERSDGTIGKTTKPYIIDLESANGTYVNYKKLEPRRFVELLERDVIKFGFSSREYVLLHEHSVNDEKDNDDNENNNDLS